jgi:hypothetical protein
MALIRWTIPAPDGGRGGSGRHWRVGFDAGQIVIGGGAEIAGGSQPTILGCVPLHGWRGGGGSDATADGCVAMDSGAGKRDHRPNDP